MKPMENHIQPGPVCLGRCRNCSRVKMTLNQTLFVKLRMVDQHVMRYQNEEFDLYLGWAN